MNTLLGLIFASASQTFDLPPGLVDSVCFVESSYNIKAIHHDDGGEDSIGICQIQWSTARWLGYKGDAKGLLDPYVNIYFAAKYLHYQLNRYNNITKATIAYNRGNSRNLTSTRYSDRVNNQWKKLNLRSVTK